MDIVYANTETGLILQLEEFCSKENIIFCSADELLLKVKEQRQKDWLTGFIMQWALVMARGGISKDCANAVVLECGNMARVATPKS